MTIKDKLLFVILTVITLGLYPIVLSNRTKKSKPLNNELSSAKKVTIDVTSLQKSLGGGSNILGIEYTHTKIKVIIKNKENVDIDAIQNLKGVSGVFATSRTVSVIVGNQAKLISTML